MRCSRWLLFAALCLTLFSSCIFPHHGHPRPKVIVPPGVHIDSPPHHPPGHVKHKN